MNNLPISFLTTGTQSVEIGKATINAVSQLATQINKTPSIKPKFLKVSTKDIRPDINAAINKENKIL